MATVSSSHLSAVQSLSKRLTTLRPSTAVHLALVAFMAGALHSLNRAIQCRFDDARMTPDVNAELVELNDVLQRISRSSEPPRVWLSGYYLISAMFRLAALGERLGEELGVRHPLASKVPDAVNSMKHDLDAGIEKGWDARFADIVQAAEDLWPLLAQVVPSAN